MDLRELESEIRLIADRCDSTNEQQAVKSVLYSLLAAMAVRDQVALMRVTADFSARQIKRFRSTFN